MKWTREEVTRRLESLSARTPAADEGLESLVRAFEEAAAVVHRFRPFDLQPVLATPAGGEAPRRALGRLMDDASVAEAESGALRFVLRPEVRRRALARLYRSGSLRAALAWNRSDSADITGSLLQSYLMGHSPPLEKQSSTELTATLRILRWLEGLPVEALPDRDDVQRQLTARRLVETLRFLVGEHFGGRKAELAALRDYVGVLPPASAGQALWRGVRDVLGWEEKRPLMVHGPGGAGKSTLLARFVLEHFESDPSLRVPFVYLDIDRSDLSVGDPLGLLREAVQQLSAQMPGAEWNELGREILELHDSYQVEQLEAEAVFSFEQNTRSGPYVPASLLSRFAGVVREATSGERPLVWILDTFEEAQYESRERLDDLWKFLADLQRGLPKLRVVLAGRAPEPGLKTQELPLPDLDLESAHGFLRDLGVGEKEAREAIVDQIGGNPLSLRLAAELVRRDERGVDSLKDLRARRAFGRRIEQGIIQGMLYTRILGHIQGPDPNIEKLAHPGLVLRVITPELILQVLRRPCRLAIQTAAEAEALFWKLSRETALVSHTDDGGLRMRIDLRRAILGQMRLDREDDVYAIHRSAIRYYARKSEDPKDRAEEIYHRLAVGHQPGTIDERWMEGLRPFLIRSIEELPPRGQAYLASKLGDVNLPAGVRERADQEDWEREVLVHGRRLLKHGRAQEALARLGERPRERWKVASELPALEVEALIALGRTEEAERRAASELELVSDLRPRYLFELLLMRGHAQRANSRLGSAAASLEEAEALAREKKLEPKDQLRAELALLEVLDADGKKGSETYIEQARQAVEVFASLTDKELEQLPSLTRRTGAVLGGESPQVLSRAITLGALPPLAKDRILEFEKTVETLARDIEASVKDPKLLESVEALRASMDRGARSFSRALERLLSEGEALSSLDTFRALTRSIAASLARGVDGE